MEARGKRQLPLWMLKGGDHEGPGNEDNRVSLQHQQKFRTIAKESGEELISKKANFSDEAPGPEKRKRKRAATSSLLDVKPSITSFRKAGVVRKKSSERKTVVNTSTLCMKSNHGKVKQGRAVSDETDGDVELTVDDLIIIAEEFVNCGKGGEHSPTAKHSLSSGSGADMVEGPFDIAQTADAAKDMLDVFLGPLLRKPVEARIPEITQDATTVGGGCSVLHGNSILEDEEVRILKRKSSLRDKVALYLD